jgi:hypothetical protein
MLVLAVIISMFVQVYSAKFDYSVDCGIEAIYVNNCQACVSQQPMVIY